MLKKTVYVLGNLGFEEDSLPLRLIPWLEKEFSDAYTDDINLKLAATNQFNKDDVFEAFKLALAQPENYSLKSFEAILKLLAEQINMNNAEILKELSIREATINKLIFLNKALEEYQKEQGNVDDEQQKEISEQPETEE